MVLPSYPNMLIIAGNGRNSGKTTFISRIITRISNVFPVTAIKITPHFHDMNEYEFRNNRSFVIEHEMNPFGDKDSSRMLSAGAREVFFLRSSDTFLPEAFTHLHDCLNPEHLWVCESGGLRHFVVPGLFLIIRRKDDAPWKESVKPLLNIADQIVYFNGHDFDLDINNIIPTPNSWHITPRHPGVSPVIPA
ncbi:MAG: hypothetical protein KKA81_14700 [Bacteroidetes bacterium]|nr:hypothetical protein [Bacteroidota bacterium]